MIINFRLFPSCCLNNLYHQEIFPYQVNSVSICYLLKNMKSLQHENPQDFYISQWQRDNKCLIYVIYRWIIAVFFTMSGIFCLVTDIKRGYLMFFWIYLTNWNLTLTMIMTSISAWISSKYYFGKIDKTSMTFKLKLFWILWASVTTGAILVSFVYWKFIHDPEKYPFDLANILKHIANSLVLNFDLFIVKIPNRLDIYAFTLIYGFIFFIFSWIYPYFGGRNE